MKRKLLFISFHRIGTLIPTSIETPTYDITIQQQVAEVAYVERIKEGLQKYDIVVAYAGLIYQQFDELVGLMSQNPIALRIVACDCDQKRRLEVLASCGLNASSIYWTHSCGGMQKMAELVSFVKENDVLPEQ